ncbi:DUF551 domain-containing protein [Enterobacter hormaechei subsp. xiangfangensis]|uniref:DUF551 domain-containing protein n=1 Tax=Enterobacter hormaechei TaxID=158836 RepID=UPI00167F3FF3|nr:DUF551 domain-containing protein [Enterobacter hormaechei]MBD1274589.1 DUF551 domain-containing protein [Enterobacter hormaechei subsp. xiangfangensis]
MTLTKEWLLKTMAELEEERDAVPGAVNEDAARALAAMKLALASLEAKAMTQVLSSRAGNDTSTIDKALPEGTMLYTAPPALVSVPDELTREEYKRRFMEEDNFDDTFRGGWSACRAAMLQGAEPVSNRDELPDGWVACSERMPEGMTDVHISNGHDVGQGWWDGDTWQTQHDYYSVPGDVTHWMPLPAAPQQEVK